MSSGNGLAESAESGGAGVKDMAGGERGWTGDLIISSAAVLSSSCGAEECDVAGRAGGAESAGEGGCVELWMLRGKWVWGQRCQLAHRGRRGAD